MQGSVGLPGDSHYPKSVLPIKLFAIVRKFPIVMSSMVAGGRSLPLSIWNVAGVTAGLNISFYLILIRLNPNNHIGLMDTVLDSTILDMLKITQFLFCWI